MGLSHAWGLFVKSLKTGYEYLGSVMLINVIWFFLWLAPLFLFSIAGIDNLILFIAILLLCMLLFGPATAGAYGLLNEIIQDDFHSITDFRKVFIKFFWRSILLVLTCGLIFGFGLLNFVICKESPILIFRLLSGIWLYLLLFCAIMFQYVFPLLVQQNIGILVIIKRAALLAIDNVLFSVAILLASLIITLISIYTVVPAVIFWLSLIGLLHNLALVQVLTKYDNSNGR